MYKRRVKRPVASPVSIPTQIPQSSATTPATLSSLQSSPKKLSKNASSTLKPLKEREQNVLAVSKSQSNSSKKRNLDEESSSCEKQLSKMFRVTSESTKPYFQEVLSSCGFEIDGQDTHMLSCDQGIFLRDLKQKFERSICLSSMVDGFLKSFEEFCENEDNFKRSLQSTKSKENENTCKTSQDSLIHLLLSLDSLQKRLIEFLFGKLVVLVNSDDRNEGRGYPWTQMILRQFKFLDCVVDPEEFLTMLFDVLDSVPNKGDVLLCLPDIIQDSQHEDTAKRLSEILLQNSGMMEITPSILDALTNLTLTLEVQRAVAESVVKSLDAVPLEYLPNMVRFLVTNTHLEDMPKIVSELRQHLDFSGTDMASATKPFQKTPGSSTADVMAPASTKSCLMFTLDVLKLSVMTSQDMAEAWLSAIKAVHCALEHRPLDLAMLLVLHAKVPNTRPVVQALFRAKAKTLLFGEKLLDKMFTAFLDLIKEYCSTVMELLFVLLRSPDPAVVQHASCWYKLCIRELPSWQGQAVVQRLLLHVGSGNAASRRAALQVFMALAKENLNCLIPHQRLLLNLLDKIPDVDLSMAEMILEVLCIVAFSSNSNVGGTLADNLLMLARKQLSSRNGDVRQKGVIGAILASKHMTSKDKEKEADASLNETIKQSIHLMELVTASTNTYSDATGLFLDKLSSVLCSVDVLDEKFLEWITDYIGGSFEQKYVATIKGLKLNDEEKLMFSLEDPEAADDDDVCIPIAHLVDQDNFNRRNQNSAILVMHSSLRLVRCVKFMLCSGSLGDIAPLLTCPVVLPSIVDQEEDSLCPVDFSCPQEQNFLLDCLFHCVNWFRELVSAFSYQKEPEIRKAVLLRLKHLVKLEDKLSRWLYMAIDYTPPPGQFYDVAKVPKPTKMKKPGKKKGVKRKKSKAGRKKARSSDASQHEDEREEGGDGEGEDEEQDAGPEGDEDAAEDDVAGEPHSRCQSVDLDEYRAFLREIDVDMLVLLQETLLLPVSSQCVPAEAVVGLSPDALLFLLKDFNAKVEHLLAPEAKRISALKVANVKPLGFANLDTFTPPSFAVNTIKMLPALCTKLEEIGEYCEQLLESSDNIRDAPSMFPDNAVDIKLCYAYILRIIAGLFNWSGFESELNKQYLKDGLRILAHRCNRNMLTQRASVPELLKHAALYFLRYVDKTLLLTAACSIVRLLSALCRLQEDEVASEQIAKTCKTFLSQRWFNLKGSEEKGAEFNQQVDYLIKELFNNVLKLKTVSNLVPVVFQEVDSYTKSASKDWSLNSYPTITKSNFPLLFRALCSALVQGLEEMLQLSISERSSFKVWDKAVNSLQGLMMIARLQNSRSNLIAFVKNSLRFLRLFLKRGIPLCGRLFMSKSTEVTSLLGALQKSTRFLNSVCYHSKATKDKTLTSQVPALRLVLEQIVVDVRSMLSKHNCQDAFWVGVLKHRNLQGEEVLSQQSEEGASIAEEEKDDLPSDEDSDVDVDLGKPRDEEENEEEEESSMSEVF